VQPRPPPSTPPPTPPPPQARTRLAPSPTGALHLGNARTFLINHALAASSGWETILRIEDLDTPRVKPGAAAEIAATLRWLGLAWTGPVLVQSEDLSPYRAALAQLARAGLAYPCALSRGDIAAASAPQAGDHETPFPPSLRPPGAGQPYDPTEIATTTSDPPNWRFLCPPGPVEFTDAFAGPRSIDPAATVGDFVLWTKRDQPSYQLAVVVDDQRQGVTHIVRGDDLLDSAARQLRLRRALGYPPATDPTFIHVPLVLGVDGRRLAKRHGDTRVEHYRSRAVPPERIIGLLAAFSGVTPRDQRTPMSTDEFVARFSLDKLPKGPITFTPEDDRWLLAAEC
jgi:glutamyl-tRNA synthetase